MKGHRLSTHLTRRRARAAQRHYEQLQYEATLAGPSGEYARVACVGLGVGLVASIEVQRAKHERGNWVVVAS